MNATMVVAAPTPAIYEFAGNFTKDSQAGDEVESLNLENTL